MNENLRDYMIGLGFPIAQATAFASMQGRASDDPDVLAALRRKDIDLMVMNGFPPVLATTLYDAWWGLAQGSVEEFVRDGMWAAQARALWDW